MGRLLDDMSLVLDCSVTIAWCFDDEASDFADGVLDRVVQDGCIVPPLWYLEVANVLLVAERRNRINQIQSNEFIELLNALPIQTDMLMGQRVFGHSVPLGRRFGLSAYDSAYLELTQRTGFELATADSRLAHAATELGIHLVGR